MYCVTPIALAAGMFSMNEGVMPFPPPTFKSFIGLSLTFAFVSFSLYLWHRWQWQRASAPPDQVRKLTQAKKALNEAVTGILCPANQSDIEQGSGTEIGDLEQGTGGHGFDEGSVAGNRSAPSGMDSSG